MKKHLKSPALLEPPSADFSKDPITPLANAEVQTPSTATPIEFDADRLGQMTPEEIATAINQSHQEAERCLATAKERLKEGLRHCLFIGVCILEIQKQLEIPWMQWLQAKCPGIAPSTAYRYRKLAQKFSHMGIEEIGSTRQAYLAAGILPDVVQKEKKKPDLNTAAKVKPADFVCTLQSFRQQWLTNTAQLDVVARESSARKQLEEELEEFISSAQKALQRIREVAVEVPGKVSNGVPK